MTFGARLPQRTQTLGLRAHRWCPNEHDESRASMLMHNLDSSKRQLRNHLIQL